MMLPFKIRKLKMRREVFQQFGNHLKVGQFQYLCGDQLMNAIRHESGKNELRIGRPEFTLKKSLTHKIN